MHFLEWLQKVWFFFERNNFCWNESDLEYVIFNIWVRPHLTNISKPRIKSVTASVFLSIRPFDSRSCHSHWTYQKILLAKVVPNCMRNVFFCNVLKIALLIVACLIFDICVEKLKNCVVSGDENRTYIPTSLSTKIKTVFLLFSIWQETTFGQKRSRVELSKMLTNQGKTHHYSSNIVLHLVCFKRVVYKERFTRTPWRAL